MTNIATVTGTPKIGTLSPVTDSQVANADSDPNKSITKLFVSIVNDVNSNGEINVGDTVSYNIVVTNTGNVTLTEVNIEDPLLTPANKTCTRVAPAATCELTGTYVIKVDDIDTKDRVVNTATATSNETPPKPETATEKIIVKRQIVANDDDYRASPVNGIDGNTNVGNNLDNDEVNSVDANTGNVDITITREATPKTTGAPVPVLDATTGNISVPVGTPAGDYEIDYQICDSLDASNCNTATIYVRVEASSITADLDDFTNSPVSSASGNPALGNAFDGDTLNGQPVNVADIDASVLSPATPKTPGAPVPTLDPVTGQVSVPVGTPAGDYEIEYEICERLNPTNCATNKVLVKVVPSDISADLDDFTGTPVAGDIGNPNLGNAFDGDLIDGNPVKVEDITSSVLTPATPKTPGAPVATLDPVTGVIAVPAGTPAGDYEIEYEICEKLNPTNCATNKVLVRVVAGNITADLDDFTNSPVASETVNPNVGNAFDGDTLNGQPVDVADIDAKVLTPATPKTPGAPVPTLNPVTGVIAVPAGTPAGDYEIEYEICEKLNPSNCVTNKVLIRVAPSEVPKLPPKNIPSLSTLFLWLMLVLFLIMGWRKDLVRV